MLPIEDIFAALRWWAVLLVLGLAVWPMAHTLLGRLPDRGYSLLKLLGLLLVSYLFWLGGSFGFWGNEMGGILVSLAGVTAVSILIYRHARQTTEMPCLRSWFKQEKRYIFLVEGLFLLLFALWTVARAYNPAIQFTEKPMEFAFLNAAFHSPHFPLNDPWLSGFAISYYHFGYVMTAVVGRLAFVSEAVAFNLGVAWLMAGTAVGAFGLVYNLIMVEGMGRRLTQINADKKQIESASSASSASPPEMKKSASSALSASPPILKPSERHARGRLGLRGQAILWGLLAALALPLAGNNQMALEIFHANGLGSERFWDWLDIRDINGPAISDGRPARYEGSGWWWWRSSRVIHEYHLSGRAEEGLEPIAEFPGFSFVLGDLHPHVLALPFAFLSLGLALQFWLSSYRFSVHDWLPDPRQRLRQVAPTSWALWGMTAVVLGGLAFLNMWDVLIHLFVLVGAIVLRQWRLRGQWDNRLLTLGAGVGLLLGAAAALLYLPFYLSFRSQAGPPFILPMLMRPTRLAHFLVIFGMPLLPIALLIIGLLCQWRRRHWQICLKLAGGLLIGLTLLMLVMGWIVTASPDGAGRVVGLAQELGYELPAQPGEGALARLWWSLGVTILLAPRLLLARLQFLWVALLLVGLLGGGVMLLCQQRLRHWQIGLKLAGGLLIGLTLLMLVMGWIVAGSPDGAGQAIGLAQELGYELPAQPGEGALARLWWGLGVTTLLAPRLLLARLQFPWVALLLAGLLGGIVMIWRQTLEVGVHPLQNGTRIFTDEHGSKIRENPRLSVSDSKGLPLEDEDPKGFANPSGLTALPFVLLLVGSGLLLTLGPEFVYLKDNFGLRLNTIFKFYYQAWVLFGVGAIFALSYLTRQWRAAGGLATAVYLLLFLFAIQFPLYGVASRAEFYRGPATLDNRAPVTLNGLAHIAHGNPDEYAALQWIRENTAVTAVILEAVGGQYSDYGRVSASTGRLTLLGWAGHQYQWRGPTPEPAERDTAVRAIYTQPGWDGVIDPLNRYEVDYIYVGHLERVQYGWAGLEKFEQLPVAFRNDNVTIYIWSRGQ